jgi:hypothetical protein
MAAAVVAAACVALATLTDITGALVVRSRAQQCDILTSLSGYRCKFYMKSIAKTCWGPISDS